MREKANEGTMIRKERLKDGVGFVDMRQLMTLEEFAGTGRLFNVMTLKPGHSVGDHLHEGDWEAYYFLSGSGHYDDNGTIYQTEPGDFFLCKDGERHYLLNNGKEDLVFLALIVYSKSNQ